MKFEYYCHYTYWTENIKTYNKIYENYHFIQIWPQINFVLSFIKSICLKRTLIKARIIFHISKIWYIFIRNKGHILHEQWQKIFCTASKLFWPEARFEGFFGLREAVRPLEGQKIPKNGPKAKRVWTKCKTILLSLQMENLVFIKSKMYFFYIWD